MNQKYFKIILGIVILILVTVGIYYFTPNRKIDNKTVNWKTDAENTVSVFTKNINTAGYGDNINIALAQLTASAQAKVKADSPDTTLAGLASGFSHFVHVQEAPDNGTSIISSEKLNDNTVRVVSKWNYSGGSSITQTFILVFENNQWKIDKVATANVPNNNLNNDNQNNSVNLSTTESEIRNRDEFRLSDTRRLSMVLELYFNDHGQYPETLQQLVPKYIDKIPQAPIPADSPCTSEQNTYNYTRTTLGSYKLTFCIGENIGGLIPGLNSIEMK